MSDQKVKSLGTRFIERTAAEVDVLIALLEEARKGEDAPLERIGRIAHGIYGTGASFGFDTVSDAAGAIVRCVRREGQRTASDKREALFEELGQLVFELKAVVKEAVSRFTPPQ